MKNLNRYLRHSLNLVNQNMSNRLKLSQSENIIERLKLSKDNKIKTFNDNNYYVIIPKPYGTLYEFLDKNYNKDKKSDYYNYITFWIFNAQETYDFYMKFKKEISGIYKFTDINTNWDDLFEHIGTDIGYNYDINKAKNFIKKFLKIESIDQIH